MQELPQTVGNLVKMRTLLLDENLLSLLPEEVCIVHVTRLFWVIYKNTEMNFTSLCWNMVQLLFFWIWIQIPNVEFKYSMLFKRFQTEIHYSKLVIWYPHTKHDFVWDSMPAHKQHFYWSVCATLYTQLVNLIL